MNTESEVIPGTEMQYRVKGQFTWSDIGDYCEYRLKPATQPPATHHGVNVQAIVEQARKSISTLQQPDVTIAVLLCDLIQIQAANHRLLERLLLLQRH